MPKRNRLSDLRDHLFETLEALRDEEEPMELDRARAISKMAETIISTARVEVDVIKAISDLPEAFGAAEIRENFFGQNGENPRRRLAAPGGKSHG